MNRKFTGLGFVIPSRRQKRYEPVKPARRDRIVSAKTLRQLRLLQGLYECETPEEALAGAIRDKLHKEFDEDGF